MYDSCVQSRRHVLQCSSLTGKSAGLLYMLCHPKAMQQRHMAFWSQNMYSIPADLPVSEGHY